MLTRHLGVPEYLAPWYAPMQAAYSEEAARILGARQVTSQVLPWEREGQVDRLPTVTTTTRICWQT